MTAIAAVYLILSFPGEPHAVLALPVANMEICERERKSIEAAYAARSKYRIFGHCVRSGLENSN